MPFLNQSLRLLLLAVCMGLAGCAGVGGQAPQRPDAFKPEFSSQEHERRGDVALRQGQPENAFVEFGKAVAADAANGQARYKKGAIMLGRGMYEPALADFSAVLEQRPAPAPQLAARVHEAAGMACNGLGMRAAALTQFDAAVALDAGLWHAHMMRGVLRAGAGEFDAAEQAYAAALALRPDDPDVRNNLGMLYAMTGRAEEAAATFRQALSLGVDPERAGRICNNLGLVLAGLDKPDQALEAFRCGTGGDAAKAYNNLGYFLFKRGQYAAAANAFENALSLSSTYYVKAAENLERARLAARVSLEPAPAASPGIPPDMPEGLAPVPPVAPAAPDKRVELAAPHALAQPARGTTVAPATPIAPAVPQPSSPEASQTTPPAAIRPISLRAPAAPSASVVPPAHSALFPDTARGASFDVHISSWRTQQAASRHCRLLAAQGIAAHVVAVNLSEKGEWSRVLVGPYPDRAAAVAALDAMRAQGLGDDARVLRSLPASSPSLPASTGAAPVAA